MIKTEALTKNFFVKNRRIEVLRSIDLEIPAGEFVSIVGKSGSGKSTLLSLMSGLDKPSSGRVFIAGQAIENFSEDEMTLIRRNKVGFIFQSYHLIPSLTALENVLVPLQLAGRSKEIHRAKELLDRVGLAERSDHYPNELSGGEQQRVSICRALIHDPEIIFADEPTGNLDTKSGEQIMKLLRELRSGSTLVLVTHDTLLADRADRKIQMIDGRIQQDDAGSARAS